MTATIVNPEKDRPKRAFSSHTAKWQRFLPTLIIPQTKAATAAAAEVHVYQRQYSHVYAHRLAALKPRCWKVLEARTNSDKEYQKVQRVLELREGVPSRLVGTLVKESNADISEEPLLPETDCRKSDQLFLEDESGRVTLEVKNMHQYCTGAVVGIQGTVDAKGIFSVDQLVLPTPAPQPKLEGTLRNSTSMAPQTPHILLVSSLLCGDPNVSSFPREMLLSYLQGNFTDDADKVCRVVVAGSGPSAQDPLAGIKEFDAFGLALAKSGIPMDVLPSQHDPTTANWPQRPLHSSLLPKSYGTNVVQRAPNPYMAVLGSQMIIGTDGLNIHDLQKHVLKQKDATATHDGEANASPHSHLDELDALTLSLQWGHMCPTGPSSVPTVPHVDEDPMVLDATPHLYFCGNASMFATKSLGIAGEASTTLIAVPKFSETGEAVLVNLETRAVELLRFEDSQS